MKIEIPQIKVKISFDKKLKREQYFKITSSKSCWQAFKTVFNADTINWYEEFILLSLNNSNQVIGFYKVASGGMTATIVDIRIIMTILLNSCATAFIVAHNHPSGKLQASEQDIQVTKKIKEAAKLLDITLLDHIIMTDESYYSFNDEGIL